MDKNDEFLQALGLGMPSNERIILCNFDGDPNDADPSAWRPRPWRPGTEIPFGYGGNSYSTVASFHVESDGSWRRRGDYFAAGRALMVDDLGTKLEMSVIDALAPSAMIETSPGNFQAWYFLLEPERDRVRFDAIIRAFIAQKLLGSDPGMSGVTRVGRLPLGTNGKAKYGGFRTRMTAFSPDDRYSVEELLEAFDLKLSGRQERPEKLLPSDLTERARLFCAAHEWLEDHDMFKKSEPDLSGWMEMHCPWLDGHTGRADTGAAMRVPNQENGWYGGFRCHHGHCLHRGWRDLTEYIAANSADDLEDANREAS